MAKQSGFLPGIPTSGYTGPGSSIPTYDSFKVGIATVSAGTTQTVVTFETQLDAVDYVVEVTPTAAIAPYVDESSLAKTGFTIKHSLAGAPCKIMWILVRGVTW